MRPQFTEKLKNISVKQGTLVELAVKAIGNPLPDIVWLKNSDIITPHKHPNIRYVLLVFSNSLSGTQSSFPVNTCWTYFIILFIFRYNDVHIFLTMAK